MQRQAMRILLSSVLFLGLFPACGNGGGGVVVVVLDGQALIGIGNQSQLTV